MLYCGTDGHAALWMAVSDKDKHRAREFFVKFDRASGCAYSLPIGLEDSFEATNLIGSQCLHSTRVHDR